MPRSVVTRLRASALSCLVLTARSGSFFSVLWPTCCPEIVAIKAERKNGSFYGLFFSFAFYEVIKEFCKGQTR